MLFGSSLPYSHIHTNQNPEYGLLITKLISYWRRILIMSNKNKYSEGNVMNKNESPWKKAFVANSEWPDKEEFLDVIYWMRQAIGIVLGLFWGLLPLKGFPGLLLFVVVNAAVIYFYVNNFQSVDEEEYGGMWEITKEGFMTSFAGFLVTWIIIYTGLHIGDSL